MVIQYKRDIRHSYMIIEPEDEPDAEAYSIKMLEKQTIEGILPLEARRMDNKTFLYYDITARQSMEIIYDKAVLSYEKVKKLCEAVIDIIERAYEFLLSEDDFVLKPELVYIEVPADKVVLCLLPGYGKPIKEQMCSLIEYLMNKVDYKDRDAVFLVYQLYSVCREEGYTFDHMLKVLQAENQHGDERKDGISERKRYRSILNKDNLPVEKANNSEKGGSETVIEGSGIRKEEDKRLSKAFPEELMKMENNIPVMLEKLEGEQEEAYYPLKVFLCSGACIGLGILIIIFCFTFKIVYNSFGTGIDYMKLFALALIILGAEGYSLRIIWDKKNMLTRMIPKNEYVNPIQEMLKYYKKDYKQNIPFEENSLSGEEGGERKRQYGSEAERLNSEKPGINIYRALSEEKGNRNETVNKAAFINHSEKNEENNPTCLINIVYDTASEDAGYGYGKDLVLAPLDGALYQNIQIKNIPFFIGKLKKNVDYCLEKDVVSRYHAKITKEDENYFITDLNSTNGTFVNGEALQTYEKREIKIGDEVAFANIKYRFCSR